MALSFMAYLYYEKGSRAVTIGNYMSAIRTQFVLMTQDVAFLDGEKIKRFRRAVQLEEGKLGIQQDKKKPLPFELLKEIVNEVLDKRNMGDQPYRIAVLMAYFFLLRQSEYIYSPRENDHAIRVSDVQFRVSTGQLIASHLLRESGFSIDEVDLVKITLRHCKNDPFRQGNSFWVSRERDNNMDFVKELAEFAWSANCREGDVFTSCRSEGKGEKLIRVTYARIMKLLRDTAKRHGLDEKTFGTHSFRIGGATALDAGRIDQKTIQQLGGWKSDTTHMQYAQPSVGRFKSAHEALLNDEIFTLKDLKLHIHTRNKRLAIGTKLQGETEVEKRKQPRPKFDYEEDLDNGVKIYWK
jgi:integrase